MKELFRQRQRELAAERAQFNEDAAKDEDVDNTTLPAASTEPKLEQMTLPPPPRAEEGSANPQPRTETVTPKVDGPPPPATRPREAEPQKKKGKKGEDEPG
jgi:hypothetical protein